jgi:hypothetical protein
MHMHLLYAMECINYADKKEDAYTVEGYTDRDLFKQLVLIALNAKSQPMGIHALIDDNPDKADLLTYDYVKAAMLAFKAKHKQVAHLFFTGIGTKLQYFDSLIAEHVINHFTRLGIPVLSVHDSFVIQSDKANELKTQMWDTYYKVVKFYINSKGKLVHGMYTQYDDAKQYVQIDNRIIIDTK